MNLDREACRKNILPCACREEGMPMQILPEPVQRALALLWDAGFEAYVVGGAVRDAILRRAPKDYDIATDASPEQIGRLFAGYRVINTGLAHGTMTVRIGHMPLEITTFRAEDPKDAYAKETAASPVPLAARGLHMEQEGAGKKAAPQSSGISRGLWADLACRDFTFNALAWHPDTGYIDPFGGAQDLADGILRCPGTPASRFREDAVRILRALRFAAVYGLRIEPQTAQALRENRLLLQASAAERVREELTQILCGAFAAGVLEEYAGVITVVLPELAPMFGFGQKNPHHDKDVWHHTLAVVEAAPVEPVLRWAALLHDIGKPACFSLDAQGIGHFYGHAGQSAQLADAILARLRFDTGRRGQIVRLVRRHDTPVLPEEKQLRRLLNKLGETDTRRLIALQRADACGQAPLCRERLPLLDGAERLLEALLREKVCFSLRDLAVNGSDMLALGLRGRAVGAALDACLGAVLDGAVPNERAALLRYAREHAEACVRADPCASMEQMLRDHY